MKRFTISRLHRTFLWLVDSQTSGDFCIKKQNGTRSCFLLPLLLTLFSTEAIASFADEYLCSADSAAGMSYVHSKEAWITTDFNVSGKQYLISKFRTATLAVREVGNNSHQISCFKGGINPKNGFLLCNNPGVGEFRFNAINGRFLMAGLGGYYNVLNDVNKVTDKNSRSPYIIIGKCSPL
tara:strand:+ start:2280 stop:2822 length:543 start_codon:yes stop_codon:yes gene_type:complete